jgi:hypothetical protein
MDDRPPVALPYRAAWVVIALVLVLAFAVWGARIGASLGPAVPVAVAPVPRATELPGIVTVNTDVAPLSAATLCAQISPPTSVITIESTTGIVVSTVHC